MNKQEQLNEIYDWLDKLGAIAEAVVFENELGTLKPFELINLLNVRLHMEESFPLEYELNKPNAKAPNKKVPMNKPNLFVLKPKKDDPN